MIKFFRKIRQKLLSENKFNKYLVYAIGEIILVVIGILIALQINNWNENRISKEQLREVYKQIKTDLEIDTTFIARLIKSYDEKDKRIQNILDGKIKPSFYDTINSLNYKDCKICISESTNSGRFEPNTKGYKLINNNARFIEIGTDSVLDAINNFYTNAIPQIKSSQQIVKDITYENIRTFEQYSWYADWTEKKYNKEFLAYIFESQEYRNQLATFRIFYRNNFISNLKYYKKVTPIILDLIERELNEK